MTSLHFVALHSRIMQGNKPPLIATAILSEPFARYEDAALALKNGAFPRRAFVQTYRVGEVEAPAPAPVRSFWRWRK